MIETFKETSSAIVNIELSIYSFIALNIFIGQQCLGPKGFLRVIRLLTFWSFSI